MLLALLASEPNLDRNRNSDATPRLFRTGLRPLLRSETACGATLLVFHELYTNGQTVVLRIVMIMLGFDGTYGGHVPCGVTAHGSPGGPLQFDRLEAAHGAKIH